MADEQARIIETRDFIIVGGGPAGLSAALVASGNGVDTLLLEKSEKLGGQVFRMIDDPVEDLLGQPAADGKELAERFTRHVEAQKIEYRTGVFVQKILCQEDYLHLWIEEDKACRARRVLLASGAKPRLLHVPGEHLIEKGMVRTDLERFRGKRVVIAGGGDEAAETAVRMANNGARVFLLVRSQLRARGQFRAQLLKTFGIEIMIGEEVASLQGEKRLEAVELVSGKRLEADVCLARIGVEVQIPEIAPPLQRHADGRVRVDESGRTSIPAIFAAGDLAEPPERRYTAVAIGKGAVVGRVVEGDLDMEE